MRSMANLPSSTRTRIQASITAKESQLALARTAYETALASGDTESYLFDSREGKQSTTLRSPSVLAKQVSQLEAEIERLYRRIEGGGIVNMNLRRKS
jgi:hypothetical protein